MCTTKHSFLSFFFFFCGLVLGKRNKKIQDGGALGRIEKPAVEHRFRIIKKMISSYFLFIFARFSFPSIFIYLFFFFLFQFSYGFCLLSYSHLPFLLFLCFLLWPRQYFPYFRFSFRIHHQKFLRLFPPFSYGLIGCRKPLHAIRVWMTNVFQILASAEFSEAGPRTDVKRCEGDRKPITWTKCQTTWERQWLDIRKERRKRARQGRRRKMLQPADANRCYLLAMKVRLVSAGESSRAEVISML